VWKPGNPNNDAWIRSASTLPIAFAQVREDPLVDRKLIERLDRPARVLMIGSGGETAALLASLPIDSLQLVDINPAQLNLAKLKLATIQKMTTHQRLGLLGHEPMEPAERGALLTTLLADLGLPADELGPPDLLAEFGPDHCGRYEWVFARLRELLVEVEEQIAALLSLSDTAEQSRRVCATGELGKQLEQAFAEAMALPTLVEIFGPDATANRVLPFAEHFLLQTRATLASYPAAENPFLHQIFLGRFTGPVWPWLNLPRDAKLCPVRYNCGVMQDFLRTQPDQSYDFIHLSNILDWIKPDQAADLLHHSWRCLSNGGIVVIRQLNSSLEIPNASSELCWQHELGDQLHRRDRSFFYRALHVGMRT
jgi:S-adenosylmethionine-diacylglycerol 3-amino-3-carboxypropyl transferase